MRYLLILLCVSSFGQRVLDKHNLPELVRNETVKIESEVWIEDTDSEIKQRAKINFLEKKIKKIHHVLQKKDSVRQSLDSLFLVIEDLEIERDSIKNILEENIKEVSKDYTNRVAFLNNQLKSVRNQYFSIRKKHQRLKKKTALIIGVCIGEGFLILLLI